MMALQFGDKKNNEYSGAVTALKGIGIFIIAFFWHYQWFYPAQYPFMTIPCIRKILWTLYRYGFLFVELFFMLSGFGMMSGYSERIKKNNIFFKEYIFRRLKKIYPLHFATLVYVVVLELIYYSMNNTYFIYFNIDSRSILLNLLLLHRGFFSYGANINGPAWTVSVCFLLYCIFYLVRKTLKRDLYFFLAMVTLSTIYLPAVIFEIEMPIYHIDIARGIICFTIGCIIEYLYSNDLLSKNNWGSGICISICIGFYIAQSLLLTKIECWQLLYIFIFLPCLIICALKNKFILSILETAIFQLLGKISMEIYFLHFPVSLSLIMLFDFLKIDYNTSTISFWFLYMLLTIAISICLRRTCFRSLFLAVKRRSSR